LRRLSTDQAKTTLRIVNVPSHHPQTAAPFRGRWRSDGCRKLDLIALGEERLRPLVYRWRSWRMPVLRPFSRLKTAARSPTVVPGIRGLHCFQRGTLSALSSRSFGVAVFSPGHAVGQEKSIVIASTTSTQDSGLFDYHSLPSTNGSFGIQ